MKKSLIAIAVSSLGLISAGAFAQSSESLGRQTTQQSAQGPETVKRVQEALVMEGYDPGRVDGEFDRRTEQALKQAQQDMSLAPTGQLDQQTLAALGVSEAIPGEDSSEQAAQNSSGDALPSSADQSSS